jgi:hypothetical protein
MPDLVTVGSRVARSKYDCVDCYNCGCQLRGDRVLVRTLSGSRRHYGFCDIDCYSSWEIDGDPSLHPEDMDLEDLIDEIY